jgi:tetratricopeptide (TPR) repeat protein
VQGTLRAGRGRLTGIAVRPEAVRQARLDAGLSLADVAEGEVTRGTIHLVETGKMRPSRRTLQLIARKTGRPLTYFLEGPEGGEEQSALRSQVECLLLSDDFPATVDLGLCALERPLEPHVEAEIRFFVGRAYTRMSQGGSALIHLRRARQLFEEAGDLRMTVKSIAQEASALSSIDDPAAVDRALEALQLCEQIRPPRPGLQSHVLILLGTIHNRRSNWGRAIRFLRQGLEMQLEKPNPRQAAVARDGLSWAYQRLGRWEEARENAEAAYAFGSTSLDPRDRAKSGHNLGYLLFHQGELEDAERYFRHAIRVCVEHGLRRDEADITLALAQIHLRRRELDAAEACARTVLELAERGHTYRADAHAWRLLGTLALERDDCLAAREAFDEAVDRFTELELPDQASECLAEYAQALEARGMVEESLTYWREAAAAAGGRRRVG